MAKYLAGVLTVIAVGVLLVAYGLMKGPMTGVASTLSGDPLARAVSVGLSGSPSAAPAPLDGAGYGYATPSGGRVLAPADGPQYLTYTPAAPGVAARAIRTSEDVDVTAVRPAPRQLVHRAPTRDWVRTALVIGGSSAAGAGVGALVGGKKGALIGAAIGGGASALFQTRQH